MYPGIGPIPATNQHIQVARVGLKLSWEPWDRGRKRQEYAAKRVKEAQAKVAVTATERSVLLEVRNARRKLETAQRQVALTDAVEHVARQKAQGSSGPN